MASGNCSEKTMHEKLRIRPYLNMLNCVGNVTIKLIPKFAKVN
jgi:hypothetical protein